MNVYKKRILIQILAIIFFFLTSFILIDIRKEPPLIEDEREIVSFEEPFKSAGNWLPNGTAICTHPVVSYYDPKIASDGSGGAIMCWYDVFGIYNYIYAQRIDSDGNPMWEPNGTIVCNSTGDQRFCEIAGDSEGNAYIAWRDWRNTLDFDIYVQKVNSMGGIEWDANGTVVCNATGDQQSIDICSDGDGGAIITWVDFRDPGGDIYAQRIDKEGNSIYEKNGTCVSNVFINQYEPRIVEDANNGAIITWYDGRNGNNDIYAQRIDADGNIKWETNGTTICNATGGSNQQRYPGICSDGLGGAIITWDDERNGISEHDIFTQRIDGNGQILWTPNGTGICNLTSSYQTNQKICSDGNNGAIITWQDQRHEINKDDVYAQKIDQNGVVQWSANGSAVSITEKDKLNPRIASDGSGGAFICFQTQNREGQLDIYTQHIKSNGEIEWNIDGMFIKRSKGIIVSDEFEMCSGGTGEAIIVWGDKRDGQDIYATKIIDMPLATHPTDDTTDINGTETINWDFSGTPTTSNGRYRVYSNDTNGNDYVWQDWTSWSDGITESVSINRSRPGIFYYQVEFQDNEYYYGGYDEVIITVLDIAPVTNCPPDIITYMSAWETIQWIIYDDFWDGQFRVIANDTNDNPYVWMDWNPWKNNTVINVPINRIALGIYEYTIEFNTTSGETGTDSVLVTITNATSATDNGNGGGGGGDLPPDGTDGELLIHIILLYIFASIAIGLGVATVFLLLRLRLRTVQFGEIIENLEKKLGIKKDIPIERKTEKAKTKQEDKAKTKDTKKS